MKLKLKLTGAINIVLAIFLIFSSSSIDAKSILLALLGGVFINYSEKPLSELKTKKYELIGLTLINLFLSRITTLIMIYGLIMLNKEKIKKEVEIEENEESQKTNNILKLGVGMVLTAGVIYATGKYDLVSDAVKLISLVLFSFLFLILSKYNEEKLNYKSGSLTYWLLSILFMVFTYICICSFSMFGYWFSFTGEGKEVVYLILSLLVTYLSLLTFKKYKNKEFKYITIISGFASYIFMLRALELNSSYILLATGLILTYFNIYPNMTKNKTVNDIKETTSAITYGYALYLLLDFEATSNWLLISNVAICIGNMAFLTYNRKENYHSYLAPILINLIICNNLYNYQGISDSVLSVIIFTFLTAYYLYFYFIGLLKKTKKFNKIYQISYNFFALIEIIFSLGLSPLSLLINCTLYILSYFGIAFLGKDKKNYEQEQSYLPGKLLIYSVGMLSIINQLLIHLTIVNIFNISFAILLLWYMFTNDKKLKYKFYSYSTITLIGALLVNTIENDTISSVTILLGFLLVYYISLLSNEKKYKDTAIFNYAFMLCALYSTVLTCNLFEVPALLSSSVLIGAYTILALLNRNREKWFYLLPIVLIIPPLRIYLKELWMPEIYGTIIINLYLIFTLLFLTSKLIKDEAVQKLINNLGMFAILSMAILKMNAVTNIYVAIVGIIIILLSIFVKKYGYMIYLGIGISIVNIISALKNYWEAIPPIIYLLLLGLILIGYSISTQTKIQSKKVKKK